MVHFKSILQKGKTMPILNLISDSTMREDTLSREKEYWKERGRKGQPEPVVSCVLGDKDLRAGICDNALGE